MNHTDFTIRDDGQTLAITHRQGFHQYTHDKLKLMGGHWDRTIKGWRLPNDRSHREALDNFLTRLYPTWLKRQSTAKAKETQAAEVEASRQVEQSPEINDTVGSVRVTTTPTTYEVQAPYAYSFTSGTWNAARRVRIVPRSPQAAEQVRVLLERARQDVTRAEAARCLQENQQQAALESAHRAEQTEPLVGDYLLRDGQPLTVSLSGDAYLVQFQGWIQRGTKAEHWAKEAIKSAGGRYDGNCWSLPVTCRDDLRRLLSSTNLSTGVIRWTVGCERDGRYREGQTIRRNDRALTLLVAPVRYYGEDAGSLGGDPAYDYIQTLIAREATVAETAALEQREAEVERQRQAQREVAEIRAQIQAQGERPAGWNDPEGERLCDTQNIYGGGDWFVVGADWIWYCQNNGMDGDDWSRNNVKTGGAGAIGWRAPYDATLADRIHASAQVLRGCSGDPPTDG